LSAINGLLEECDRYRCVITEDICRGFIKYKKEKFKIMADTFHIEKSLAYR
jgi:hypothetical protein